MSITIVFYFQINSWWSLISNHEQYDIFLFSNQIKVINYQRSCALRHFSIFKSNHCDQLSIIMCITTFFYLQINSWWSLIINHVHYDIFLFSKSIHGDHWSLIMCITTFYYFQIKSWWSLIINHVHYDIFLFSNQIMVITDN